MCIRRVLSSAEIADGVHREYAEITLKVWEEKYLEIQGYQVSLQLAQGLKHMQGRKMDFLRINAALSP